LDERAAVRAADIKFDEVNGTSLFEGAESSPPASAAKAAEATSMSFLRCALMLGLAVGAAVTAGMAIKRSSAGKWLKSKILTVNWPKIVS